MRRRSSKLKMGLRGRTGFLAYMLFGTAVLIALYYFWNNFLYTAPAKITYSAVQGLNPGHVQQWGRQMEIMQDGVVEEPPIGLNKEIELQEQMRNEQWKKAKALQDRIDEERLLEEQAVRKHKEPSLGSKKKAAESVNTKSLLFRSPDLGDKELFSKLERVVHIDLKGAPPLVSYFEQLFPVLKKLGATGLLMEYEDMFPFSGNLSILAANNAYSQSDLQRIQEAAKVNALEIIPLVQTFGHMEFVLKHRVYKHLRESEYTPQVITPIKEESYALIYDILDQIMKAHPNSRRVHLGCDEVYELGKGKSSDFIASQRITPRHLFLTHVAKIARHVKAASPSTQLLLWDDWLRDIPYDVLADSGLGGLVEPVVWYYQHSILDRIPPRVWDTYSKLFPAVWVASAFKGATGSAQILTNASVHLDNNLQWVDVIRSYAAKIKFRGTILTGWQRYDHFATLCELLPVGLPSLALCLQAVGSGGFESSQMSAASKALRCSNALDLEFPSLMKEGARVTQDCAFPGAAVYYGVQQLWGIMEIYQRDKGLQERIAGWMTEFHMRRGISSPGQMRVLRHKLDKVADKLQSLVKPMRENLRTVYDMSTIDEWVSTNLIDRKDQILSLRNRTNILLVPQEWPARPFPEQTTQTASAMVEGGKDGGSIVQQTGLKGQQNGVGGSQILDQTLQKSGVHRDTQSLSLQNKVKQSGVLQSKLSGGQQNMQANIAYNMQSPVGENRLAMKARSGVVQPKGPQLTNIKLASQFGAPMQNANAPQLAGSSGGLKAAPYQQSLGRYGSAGNGGALAHALLPGSSLNQGRPSGPDKIRPVQNVRSGLPKNAQGLRQYVPGLQATPKAFKALQDLNSFNGYTNNPMAAGSNVQNMPQGPLRMLPVNDLPGDKLPQRQLGFGQNIRGLQLNPSDNKASAFESAQELSQTDPRLSKQLSRGFEGLAEKDKQEEPKFHPGVLENPQEAEHNLGQPVAGEQQLGAPQGKEKKLEMESHHLSGSVAEGNKQGTELQHESENKVEENPHISYANKGKKHDSNLPFQDQGGLKRENGQFNEDVYGKGDENKKALLDSFFGHNNLKEMEGNQRPGQGDQEQNGPNVVDYNAEDD